MSVSVLEKIQQYQKSIVKYQGNEEKLLYYIKKLSQLPVTVAHLQDTGVGRTINSLRKSNGDVRAAAKSLVSKWKDMVAAEEAEGEEETEEVVPETKYTSPEVSVLKRRVPDDHADQLEKKRRKDFSPEHHSHHDLVQSRNSHHQNDDDRRKDRSPEKKKSYSPQVAEATPQSPGNPYENGHYSESDDNELRIEDDVREEESQSVSDVEPKRIQRSLSQDSSDGESMKKASSSKSHSYKDSKHRESSKHHHDRDKSSRKDHSSSSHKSTEEKKDKSEKSHRKHEKHKNKESSREDEARKSPKKSHHSSSSKSKDKESRSRESSLKLSPVKIKSERSVVKIKQEPVDTYEVKVKQEPVDTYSDKSSSDKADKSGSKKSSSSSASCKSDKHKDKRKSSDKDRSKEKKEKKEEKRSSQREKMRDLEDNGVDSYSGASFGDVLGMIGPTKSSKKKSLSSPSTSKGVAGYDPERPDLNYEKVKIKFDRDILDSPSEEEGYSSGYSSIRPSAIEENLYLPEISPHYKPLPQPNYSISPTKKVVSEDEALSHIISSKQMRTKVYSGNKSGYTHVPSLFEICTRVLQDNIEALGYTGGVPFDLLKPVLEHATAEQLHLLEHYNPYLIEDTDAIWQFHCQKDFRNKKREEMETWRDMYLRCVDEREQKLKSLTSSIQNSMSKWTPVRKTKLAYVEGTVKPPRGVARKQAKYGIPQPKASASTSKSSSFSPKPSTSTGSSTTTSSSFGGRQNVLAAPTVSVPNPRAGTSHSSAGSLKPKPKAPLMQKALQLVRNRFKR